MNYNDYEFPIRMYIYQAVTEAMPEEDYKKQNEVANKIWLALEKTNIPEQRFRGLRRAYKHISKQYGEQSRRLGEAYGDLAKMREQMRDVKEFGGTYRRLREAEGVIRDLKVTLRNQRAEIDRMMSERASQ